MEVGQSVTPDSQFLYNGTSEIFGLWVLRKYTLLCESNVHNKEHAPLKQNRCIFLCILVWNIFSDLNLHVTCGQQQ